MVYDCPLGGGTFGMMGYGWIFQIVIFAAFFTVIWWLIKNNKSQERSAPLESPKDILKRRLAKGEISKKEYEDLKKEITQ